MKDNFYIEDSMFNPNVEFIVMARKPLSTDNISENIEKYGVGGINIDECRVPFESTPNPATNPLYRLNGGYKTTAKKYDTELSVVNFGTSRNEVSQLGRFPANTILTYDQITFDEVCSGFPENKASIGVAGYSGKYKGTGWKNTSKVVISNAGYTDSGSASRYFKNCQYGSKDIERNK